MRENKNTHSHSLTHTYIHYTHSTIESHSPRKTQIGKIEETATATTTTEYDKKHTQK